MYKSTEQVNWFSFLSQSSDSDIQSANSCKIALRLHTAMCVAIKMTFSCLSLESDFILTEK